MPNVSKVRAGDSILKAFTHDAFNAFADAANGTSGPPAALDGEWSDPYGCRVKVQNDTGGNLDRFAVVGLGAPIFDSSSSSGMSLQYFKNQPLLSGATPVVATHWNKPAVLLQSILSGKQGDALIAGVVPVQIDIQHIAHRWADVQASTVSLKSYATGSCQILTTPTQAGVQWCLVQMGEIFRGTLIGKVDAGGITANNSGSVSIYDPSAHTDIGYDVTAYTVVALTAAKWVTIEDTGAGTWHAFKWEC